MKLIRYTDKEQLPRRCVYTCTVPTLGNPFSDEKSALARMKRAVINGLPFNETVIYITKSTPSAHTVSLYAYIVDMT
jgi:hypothetical protein